MKSLTTIPPMLSLSLLCSLKNKITQKMYYP